MYSVCALPVDYERSWNDLRPRVEERLAYALRDCTDINFAGPVFVPEYTDDNGVLIEASYIYSATGVKE